MGFLSTIITGSVIGALVKWQYDERLGSAAEMRLKLSNADARIGHLQSQQKEAAKLRQELSEVKSKVQELQNKEQESEEESSE
jgi:hypothetical protein